MASAALVVRFFLIVSPLPPLMVRTFVVIGAAATVVVLMDVERTADVLVPLFALQAFASSSGFVGPARRGYYDMLLTSGERRLTIALVHWLMSIGPGLLTWLWIAVVEAAARQSRPSLALAGGSAAAIGVVSMLGWAFTVTLPRFSGAIGWLVVVVSAGSLWRLDRVFDEGGPTLLMALAALLNPAVLIGQSLGAVEALAVLGVLALSAVAVGAACAWIASADYPLEAAQ